MAPPEMAQINRTESFHEVPLYANTDFDDDEGDEYERWMMEDHPLRSYPTECCPGMLRFSAQGGRVFRLVCVVVIFLYVCLFISLLSTTNILGRVIIIQFLAILPSLLSYLLPRDHMSENLPLAQWPSEFNTPNSPGRCLSYNPRTHTDSIQYALTAGCTGAKADLWLHRSDLLVGSSFANLDGKHTLQSLYLEPLLANLEARSAAGAHGLFDDSAQSFVLLLELKTSRHAALSHLISQLDGLRQKGYLTRMEGLQVIPGPVTVVVTGQDWNRVDRPFYEEIFFDASLDELTLEDYEQPWKLSSRGSSAFNDARVPIQDTQKGLAETPTAAIYSVTANFPASIGYPRRGRLSPQQIALIRAQISAAHRRGIRVRYEGIPAGRGRLSEYLWRVVVQEGADVVDVDWQASYQQAWWQRWILYRPT